MFHIALLIMHLSWLGFEINWKKKSPHPLQQVEKVMLDSLWSILSEPRQMDLLKMLHKLLAQWCLNAV